MKPYWGSKSLTHESVPLSRNDFAPQCRSFVNPASFPVFFCRESCFQISETDFALNFKNTKLNPWIGISLHWRMSFLCKKLVLEKAGFVWIDCVPHGTKARQETNCKLKKFCLCSNVIAEKKNMESWNQELSRLFFPIERTYLIAKRIRTK